MNSTDAASTTEEEELELTLSGAELDDSLRAALDGKRFTRVTLVEHSKDRAAFEALPRIDKDKYWLQKASAQQADILMTTQLQHERRLRTEWNEKFWLNISVYLVACPVSFFVADCDFLGEARLEARLIDLSFAVSELEQSGAELLPLPVAAEFTDAELDFIDRTGMGLGTYLLCFVVPPGLLSRSGERVEREVSEVATVDLAARMSEELATRAKINGGRLLASFELDLDGCTVERRAGDTVEVAIPLRLHTDSLGLSDYRLETAGHPPVIGKLEDVEPEDGRIWIRHSWPLPADATTVRLRVSDAQSGARRYTFAIREREEPER